MRVTIYNDFHGTEVDINVPQSGILSAWQVKRIRRDLCGSERCCCDKMVLHDPSLNIETTFDGRTGLESFKIVLAEVL